MNSAWKRFLTTAVVALILVTSMASVAFAAPDTTTTGSDAVVAAGVKKGPAPQAVLAYISGKTNVDMKTLMGEYKSGKTLEEICAAHGVDWSVIQAVFAPNQGNKKENAQKAIQNIEKRIAKLLEEQANIQEKIAKGEEAVAKLRTRIEGMKNETLKGFAERELEILQHRIALAKEHLELIGDQLALARDMLEYAKSI